MNTVRQRRSGSARGGATRGITQRLTQTQRGPRRAVLSVSMTNSAPHDTSRSPSSATPDDAAVKRAVWVRRGLLAYDVAILLGLVALASLYFKTQFIGHTLLPNELRGLPVYTAWFGMLGSVAISFKGIADHGPEESWTGRWPLWYVGRPFAGLLVGIVTYVLLRAIYPSGHPTAYTFEAAAFILGTQEQRFFQFLAEVGKLIVHVPTSDWPRWRSVCAPSTARDRVCVRRQPDIADGAAMPHWQGASTARRLGGAADTSQAPRRREHRSRLQLPNPPPAADAQTRHLSRSVPSWSC